MYNVFNKSQIVQFICGFVFGFALIYASFVMRSHVPALWFLGLSYYADYLDYIVFSIIGALGIVYCVRRRYAVVAGLVASYPAFYILFIVFVGIACGQGSCL